ARQAGPVRQLGPGVAAVGRAVDTAAGTAAGQEMGAALRLPEGGVEDARVGRVHREVDRAGFVAPEEELLPALAAVLRTIDAALAVRPPGVAERRHVDEVGVLRVDTDAGDVARLGEAEVLPAPAAVGRAVDAVAVGDVAADAALAHAG